MSLASYPRKLLVNVVYRIEAVIQENIRMDREIQGTGCPLFRDEERPGQGPAWAALLERKQVRWAGDGQKAGRMMLIVAQNILTAHLCNRRLVWGRNSDKTRKEERKTKSYARKKT